MYRCARVHTQYYTYMCVNMRSTNCACKSSARAVNWTRDDNNWRGATERLISRGNVRRRCVRSVRRCQYLYRECMMKCVGGVLTMLTHFRTQTNEQFESNCCSIIIINNEKISILSFLYSRQGLNSYYNLLVIIVMSRSRCVNEESCIQDQINFIKMDRKNSSLPKSREYYYYYYSSFLTELFDQSIISVREKRHHSIWL